VRTYEGTDICIDVLQVEAALKYDPLCLIVRTYEGTGLCLLNVYKNAEALDAFIQVCACVYLYVYVRVCVCLCCVCIHI
jgi:hypothetical protein